jgi:hypothetical protein
VRSPRHALRLPIVVQRAKRSRLQLLALCTLLYRSPHVGSTALELTRPVHSKQSRCFLSCENCEGGAEAYNSRPVLVLEAATTEGLSCVCFRGFPDNLEASIQVEQALHRRVAERICERSSDNAERIYSRVCAIRINSDYREPDVEKVSPQIAVSHLGKGPCYPRGPLNEIRGKIGSSGRTGESQSGRVEPVPMPRMTL